MISGSKDNKKRKDCVTLHFVKCYSKTAQLLKDWISRLSISRYLTVFKKMNPKLILPNRARKENTHIAQFLSMYTWLFLYLTHSLPCETLAYLLTTETRTLATYYVVLTRIYTAEFNQEYWIMTNNSLPINLHNQWLCFVVMLSFFNFKIDFLALLIHIYLYL